MINIKNNRLTFQIMLLVNLMIIGCDMQASLKKMRCKRELKITSKIKAFKNTINKNQVKYNSFSINFQPSQMLFDIVNVSDYKLFNNPDFMKLWDNTSNKEEILINHKKFIKHYNNYLLIILLNKVSHQVIESPDKNTLLFILSYCDYCKLKSIKFWLNRHLKLDSILNIVRVKDEKVENKLIKKYVQNIDQANLHKIIQKYSYDDGNEKTYEIIQKSWIDNKVIFVFAKNLLIPIFKNLRYYYNNSDFLETINCLGIYHDKPSYMWDQLPDSDDYVFNKKIKFGKLNDQYFVLDFFKTSIIGNFGICYPREIFITNFHLLYNFSPKISIKAEKQNLFNKFKKGICLKIKNIYFKIEELLNKIFIFFLMLCLNPIGCFILILLSIIIYQICFNIGLAIK